MLLFCISFLSSFCFKSIKCCLELRSSFKDSLFWINPKKSEQFFLFCFYCPTCFEIAFCYCFLRTTNTGFDISCSIHLLASHVQTFVISFCSVAFFNFTASIAKETVKYKRPYLRAYSLLLETTLI